MTDQRADSPFQRPADYWLRRARRYLDAGAEQKALPLLRHALRLAPQDVSARYLYAEALHDLECCEASNREAFAVLARQPERWECYGILASNFTKLGLKQPAQTAYARYAKNVDMWEREYGLWGRFADRPPMRSRLDGLLDIAYRRLMARDLDGARRALIRSSNPPYFETDADRELLLAMYELMNGNRESAAAIAEGAVRVQPRETHVLCMAATILAEAGRTPVSRVRRLLFLAMAGARNALDEVEAADAMEAFGAFGMSACLLSARLRQHPTRLSTMYNLAVSYLHLGNLPLASRYAHRCRDLDPQDMYAESLWHYTEDWTHRRLSAAKVRAASARLALYGHMRQDEIDRMAAPLTAAVKRGMRAFAQSIQADELLRRRYLELATLKGGALADKLPKIVTYMDEEHALVFVREALTGEPSQPVKDFAIGWLAARGLAGDAVLLRGGTLTAGDLTPGGDARPTFMQRQLVRRIAQAGYYVRWPGFNVAALRTLKRMTHRQRCLLVDDRDWRWPFAFAMVVSTQYGLTPPILDPFELVTPERIAALADHARRLRPRAPK